MIKSHFKTLKVAGLTIVALMIGFTIYHELWFLEYYQVPPISFIEVEPQRAKLINGIASYQSTDEFEAFLKRSTLQWEVGEENQATPKSRPPFNIFTITIKNYYHLGFGGDLSVVFFNNRLMSTIFYPAKFEGYLEALAKMEGIKFSSSQETTISTHTRLRHAKDYKSRKYVDWSDIRLAKEVELWIKRYS